MELRLSDKEANAVKHALEHYGKSLEGPSKDKGIDIEKESVKMVLEKMMSSSGASGV